jgi:hypothetical protein
MRQQVRRIRDQIARADDRNARIWICPDSGLVEAGPGFRTKPAFRALTAITGGS